MLQIEHLTKTYRNGKRAVDDLTLHVQPGDLYAFIGHNGAGKTTTLKCVAGIQNFENGTIRIGGHSVSEEPILCKSQIAYIPDDPDLYGHMTGIQYLRFIADVFAVPTEARTDRIRRYGDAFALTPSLGDLISSYSHGMKQKLCVIAALLHEPKLMLLDEPFVGLDPKAALTLKELMRDVCAAGGAVFFSTHVLDVAERLCNKVAIIKNGRLVAAGAMAELTGGESLESVFMEVVEGEKIHAR